MRRYVVRPRAHAVAVAVAVAGFAFTATGCKDTAADEAAIRETFSAYQSAAFAGDGEDALTRVSAQTIARWDEYAVLAREADTDTMRALDTMDRLAVTGFRLQVPADTLATADGAGLFVYGVGNGLLNLGAIRAASLGVVSVDGDRATAEMLIQGRRAPILEFVREEAGWRWDLGSVLEVAGQLIEEEARESGMSVDQLLFTQLSIIAGRPIDESIYGADPDGW